MKTLAKWPLLALMWSSLSASAWATDATSLICGPDPTILTPIYPILEGSKPKLGVTPDVTFAFEGEKPCETHQCRISIRKGDTKEIISEIKILSEDITYCREKNPLAEWPGNKFKDNKNICDVEIYTSSRIIAFGRNIDDIDIGASKAVYISWFQNKNSDQKNIFECGGPYSAVLEPDLYLKIFRLNYGMIRIID